MRDKKRGWWKGREGRRERPHDSYYYSFISIVKLYCNVKLHCSDRTVLWNILPRTHNSNNNNVSKDLYLVFLSDINIDMQYEHEHAVNTITLQPVWIL